MDGRVLWTLGLLALLLVLCRPAVSQQVQPDWYSELGGLYSPEADIHRSGLTRSWETETGLIVSGVAGRFFPQFRAEGELFLFENDFNSLSTSDAGLPLSGDQSSFGGMASLYYDFVTAGRWQPYVGLGVGYMRTSIDAFSLGTFLADDRDSGLAYQFRAGFTIPYNDNTDFLFGYRFLGSEDFSFRDSNGELFSADGFESHAIEGRFRFRF